MRRVDFSELTPLAGGWSGQTFLAEAGGERVGGADLPTGASATTPAPEIDAAVLRLVRGLRAGARRAGGTPRGSPPPDRPGLLVTSYLPGERGDLLLPTLDARGLAVLGPRLGALAADLAGMPTLRAGPFVDADLAIGAFGGADGLPGFVDDHAAALAWDEPRSLDAATRGRADAQALLDTRAAGPAWCTPT